MVEHPGGNGDVELAVLERQLLDVRDARVDASLAREVDHVRRQVDGDDLGAGVARDPLRELAPAAADLEHPLGLRLHDRRDERHSRVRAGRRAGERRRPPPETGVIRVFARDERRVIEPGQPTAPPVRTARRSEPRECPCRARGPPSHAFTVAPTSANSPVLVQTARPRCVLRRRRAAARAPANDPSTAWSGRSRGPR